MGGRRNFLHSRRMSAAEGNFAAGDRTEQHCQTHVRMLDQHREELPAGLGVRKAEALGAGGLLHAVERKRLGAEVRGPLP